MKHDAVPRAVLDASALVPHWFRMLLSDLAHASPASFKPVWCEWIIAETWRVLTVRRLRLRPVISLADERQLTRMANEMLLHLLPVMEFVSVVPPFAEMWATASDANDRPVWTATVRGNASYVVSHNVRDFPPRNADGICAFRGIEFITPENFVRHVPSLSPEVLAIPPRGRVIHQRQRL